MLLWPPRERRTQDGPADAPGRAQAGSPGGWAGGDPPAGLQRLPGAVQRGQRALPLPGRTEPLVPADERPDAVRDAPGLGAPRPGRAGDAPPDGPRRADL